MIRIINFRIDVKEAHNLKTLLEKKYVPLQGTIKEIHVVRRAVDARKKPHITFVYTLFLEVEQENAVYKKLSKDKNVSLMNPEEAAPIVHGQKEMIHRPVVVGFGPAGMLAAFYLAREGYKPIVLERGQDVDTRTADVERFWKEGQFKEESNVQFGEGGAGTFSDGKLTTRVTHPRLHEIAKYFVEFGAPEEILYKHKPHVGTDILRHMVKRMRERIVEWGGEVYFGAKVVDFEVVDGAVTAVLVEQDGGAQGRNLGACDGASPLEFVEVGTIDASKESLCAEESPEPTAVKELSEEKVLYRVPTENVLLGIGHSARDTYEVMHKRGVHMVSKAFAIGVRIEHPQDLIDQSQYGISPKEIGLGAAEYSLVYHDKENDRSVYSFCMCPGGQVVASASERNYVVTNGMSLYARDSGIANSAIVVTVGPNDFGEHPLAGVEFQRKWEREAFLLGGKTYAAPIQTVGNFLGRVAHNEVRRNAYSYEPSVVPTDLHNCLPPYVTASLEKALPYFGNRIKGFDHNDVCMTGVETRTSSPLRMPRTDGRQSENTKGLYPMGEGAGYAGGIMSAALDGAETAIALMSEYKPL